MFDRTRSWIVGAAGLLALLIAALAMGGAAQAQEEGRAFLGVRVENRADGALVQEVLDDSPADEAGLRAGDLIQAIDGAAITLQETLSDLLADYRPGDEVALTVERRRETINLPAVLGEAPDDLPLPATAEPTETVTVTPDDRGFLGVSVLTLTPEIAAREGLSVDEGALVREIYTGMPADRAGIEPGDIITAVNGEPVDQERTLTDRLYPYEVGDTVTLTVLRGEDERTVEATLAARPLPPALPTPATPGAPIQIVPVLPGESQQGVPGGSSISGGVTINGPVYVFVTPDGLSLLPPALLQPGQVIPLPGQGESFPLPFGPFGGPNFDWQGFLQEHPDFMERLQELMPNLDWQQWLDLLPDFPWGSEQDPFHQGVDPDFVPDEVPQL